MKTKCMQERVEREGAQCRGMVLRAYETKYSAVQGTRLKLGGGQLRDGEDGVWVEEMLVVVSMGRLLLVMRMVIELVGLMLRL